MSDVEVSVYFVHCGICGASGSQVKSICSSILTFSLMTSGPSKLCLSHTYFYILHE